ncbi:MAG: hypothetical protein GH148_02840 [Clostridia bacterium]|nr:hypothetical protein [Clostridia bacterium]
MNIYLERRGGIEILESTVEGGLKIAKKWFIYTTKFKRDNQYGFKLLKNVY